MSDDVVLIYGLVPVSEELLNDVRPRLGPDRYTLRQIKFEESVKPHRKGRPGIWTLSRSFLEDHKDADR